MRLTKFNPETGLYEYKENARTQAEYNEQRKAVIQKLGEYEDKEEKDCDTCAFYNEDRDNQPCCYCVDHNCWERGEEDE